MAEKILVIRLGALGDLLLCCQAFHDIRQTHPGAEIALLTTAPFADFAGHMPWFNQVIVDTHPTLRQIGGWLSLVGNIRRFKPTRVYDLQGKFRQTVLYTLLGGPVGPTWSGAAPLCAFPRFWPPAPEMSFKGFLAAQLRLAGVAEQTACSMAWLDAPVDFKVPEKYVVLIAGCTPGQTYKRWPAEFYGQLALRLEAKGLSVVTVGTKQDADAIGSIKSLAPGVTDFGGQTNLFQLAAILRRAVCVVGNDTGPMHMAAELGTPTLALLSARTNPVWSAPRGVQDRWLQAEPLSDLGVDEVFLALSGTLDKTA